MKLSEFLKPLYRNKQLKTILLKALKFLLLIICSTATSCFSTKKLIKKSENIPTTFSTELINGIYKNEIINNDEFGLWGILIENKKFIVDTLASKKSLVKLELVNNTKLKASLIKNDSIIKIVELKGKIKNNYFSIKRKLFTIPIPALFLHAERKTIIGNNKKGNLILSHGFKNSAWILIMTSNIENVSHCEIKKIKN